MLEINNVKMPLKQTDARIKISQLLNVSKNKIKNVQIVKQAVDARRKNNIHFLCSYHFEIENEAMIIKKNPKVSLSIVEQYNYPFLQPTNQRIVVVGSGPAGLFCAYQLARSKQEVILIERGSKVEKRKEDIDLFFKEGILQTESNVQFGEGGAGTFSDGKLTTGVKDHRKQFILNTLVTHGAPKEILYRNKPHVGTDYLMDVVKNMRLFIEENGGKVIFDTKLEDIHVQNNKIESITMTTNGKQEKLSLDKLVLAIGHSARDTYRMLDANGIKMEQKPFAVGLRIEHLQSFINECQYGQEKDNPILPVADYKLAVQSLDKRGVYSFCMCPGGQVVNASSQAHHLVVNGMSNFKREQENANSAILVTVNREDFGSEDVLAGVEFQEKLEQKAYELGGSNYHVPVQRIEDYLNGSMEYDMEQVIPSVLPAYKYAKLEQLFSYEINQSLKQGLTFMDKKIPGFISQAVLSGVESRSSAPVRIYRDEKMCSNIQGIYPIGEGAGYAGGIMSSAIDGLKCSENLLQE
ncbi:NAD(P)/FAD-dependent oxidoreductase [Tannockella kyphosi]|uniref:NAD(P)/FAD-dependent oxidoreductase n=1 Tax=Tannockella kyphosi TaxID=2899121 RepID=UPI002012779D|nr:FAD-dependent oxidoreductase [Tannockella kyphosi]